MIFGMSNEHFLGKTMSNYDQNTVSVRFTASVLLESITSA